MKTFKQFLAENVIKLRGNSSTQTKPFMDEFHSISTPHPMNHHARVIDGVTVHASEHGGEIHLHDIQTQGVSAKGSGSKVLRKLHGIADKHNVIISGHAKAYSTDPHHITSQKKLTDWYKGHGYVIGQGSDKDGYSIKRRPKRLH